MVRRMIVGCVAVVALAAGCSSKTPPPKVAAPPPSATPSSTPSVSMPPYHPSIDPANFTDQITNPYFPLTAGTVLVYQGTRDGVPLRNETTITKETKVIMGVRCVVVRDIVTGALEERTTDWYAQDKDGNVWYFGEDTKEYTNGVVTSTAGTWEAGVNGALPGIIMPAHPSPSGLYRQEYRPGVAEDVAKVVKYTNSTSVPAGNYRNVLVTEDTDLLDPSKLEHKFYAPSVGMVYLTGVVNGHHEVVKLSSILHSK